MGRTRKVLIIVFSCICGTNILIGIAPSNTKVGKLVSQKLDPTRWTIGLGQTWDMFHSIPTYHRLQVHVTAKNEKGENSMFGAGLPGLEEVIPLKMIRYHYTFLRTFQNPINRLFRDAYIQALGKELHKVDPQLVEFTLHLKQTLTNSLESIRSGGELTTNVPESFGPYPIPRG